MARGPNENPVSLVLTNDQARSMAQAVKRLNRSNLGRDGLNICTPEEVEGAEAAFIELREALARAGWWAR